jgi:hypothetical protein
MPSFCCLHSVAILCAIGASVAQLSAIEPWTLTTQNGRQTLLTPEGKPFVMLGLSHASAVFGKEKPDAARLDAVEAQLRGWGFNTVPAVELWDRFPFIVPLDRLVGDDKNRYEDVFDPAFKARLRKKIETAVAKAKNNPNCIGYWWTDIPPYQTWSKQKLGKSWPEYLRDLPPGSAGRNRYDAFLAEHGSHDETALLRLIVRELYAETAKVFEELDPQRLQFGERFDTLGVPDAVLEEAAKFVDVISIQPYDKVFNTARFDAIHKLTGKPIVISDWNLSFPTPAHAKTMWPQFATPEAAAEAYEAYLTAAFSRPYMLGYFKCQLVDAVLPTGMLKQGLLESRAGPARDSFAARLRDIHQRLLRASHPVGGRGA